MTALGQARLVNEPFGDAALFFHFQFARRALLFDLGDLAPLSPRSLLRVGHVFVSHAHMDHFIGFDRLLGIRIGRDQPLTLFGPPGFADRVAHKLGAYTWNLVVENPVDLMITACEFDGNRLAVAAEFHSREGFRRRDKAPPNLADGVLLDEAAFAVRASMLDHGTPSLAFALEGKLQVNVRKDGLRRLDLPAGPWLKDLKETVRGGARDDEIFTLSWRERSEPRELRLPLGKLKAELVRMAPGAKLAYVVDASFHEKNMARIVALARGADQLFIEAAFLDKDAALAAERHHLTAAQAGTLARAACVKRVVPFHFSPRYRGSEELIRREVDDFFHSTAATTKSNVAL